jgi:tetratricopeptide (TPR) repeat protein
MRTNPSRQTSRPWRSDVTRLQERLAFRLLLVFLVPVAVIVVLGAYAYRLSARVREVEVLERVSYIDRIFADTKNAHWARREYESLAVRNPGSQRIFVRLGALYQEDGQPDAAIESLNRAIALDPNDWEAYSTLSYVLLRQKRDAKAIEAGEKALQRNATDAQTYNNLAWIYGTTADAQLRDAARARDYAEKAVGYTRCLQEEYRKTLAEVYGWSAQGDQAALFGSLAAERRLCGPERFASGSETDADGAGRLAIATVSTLPRR